MPALYLLERAKEAAKVKDAKVIRVLQFSLSSQACIPYSGYSSSLVCVIQAN